MNAMIMNLNLRGLHMVKEANQTVQVDKLGRIYVYKNTLKSIDAKPGDWVKVTIEKVE